MSEQPSTSLRVRFAVARGITVLDDCAVDFSIHPKPGHGNLVPLPPIDANTVREALMGMTDDEWHAFSISLMGLLKLWGYQSIPVLQEVLKTPPPTLAEIYCEVKGEILAKNSSDTENELRDENKRLREALSGMLENYIELKRISLAMARSDAPDWIGARMTPDDDVHVIAARKALTKPT